MTTAPAVLDAERLLTDDLYFYENLIVIEDRNRKPLAFKVNKAQQILHDKLTNRDIAVKAGQLGITTFFLARYLKETLTVSGTTAVVVAHEEFLTQRLLHRTTVMYNYFPSVIHTTAGPIYKPRMNQDSANQKSFKQMNSTFYIGTARAFVFGRGEPIHRFLGSEVAFWPDANRILVPTMQRVPLDGEMMLESTPNGEGNRFHEIVMEARSGNSIWTLHQLHWWFEDEYKIVRGDAAALPPDRGKLTFTSDETSLIVRAGWPDTEAEDRTRWRRRKIREINVEFWQEFMEDLSSCFLMSGNMFYDENEIERLRQNCYPAPYRFQNTLIWEQPDTEWDNPNYLIAVDPGQGKVSKSVATVWRINITATEERPLVQHVATLSGLYDPQTFAPMVEKLARYYFTAKIAPERNGHGMAFCGAVALYPNLYRQTDVVNGFQTKVIGWSTTGAARLGSRGTKTYMMDELNHLLPDIECHDEDILVELTQVRIAGDGKFEFVGKGDDFHDSAAIMAATRSSVRGAEGRGFAGTKGWR